MLETSNQILQQYFDKIAQNMPGFKPRSTQRQMINEVFEALMRSLDLPENPEELPPRQGESILVVEGPTGTGKSLAYLLPAIVAAKLKKKHLVVSSATVMLQEQLAHKDIPFVVQHAGFSLSYVIAKGRSRYACPQRLAHYSAQTAQTDMIGQDPDLSPLLENPDQDELQVLKHLALLLEQEQWSGDRDMLSQAVPDRLWQRVTNDRHGCLKKDCQFYKKCPFFLARAKLEEADIIIANHDLLLADLSMGGGVILTDPQHTFYCLDEAHHLPAKAIAQFAGSHAIFGTLKWLEKIPVTVAKAETVLKESKWLAKMTDLTETISGILQDVSVSLSSIPELQVTRQDPKKLYRGLNSELPPGFMVFCQHLLPSLRSLYMYVQLLRDNLRKNKSKIEYRSQEALMERLATDLGFYIARLGNLLTVWNLLHSLPPQDQPPIARWFSAELTAHGREIEYYIHASPVRIGDILAQSFWRLAAGAVLTSATLRALGSFDKLLMDTGLNDFRSTKCIPLASPFNFAKQASLVVPKMQSDPKDAASHTQELIRLLPQLIDMNKSEGVLVLFASKKQMDYVVHHLPRLLQQKLLIQGQKAKEQLVREHFARINNQGFSALFGLASFSEGLDLPGKACTHVIIAKLPFAVPDDPVSLTLAEWVTLRGGHPFNEITLPETSLKLIQAVGRLIRSETDWGKVTILDRRLITKNYGRQLRKNLPPFKLCLE